MTDSALAILLVVGYLIAFAAVRWFLTLQTNFFEQLPLTFGTGLLAGVAILLTARVSNELAIAGGCFVALACIYLRFAQRETEIDQALLIGGVCGAAAALPTLGRSGMELPMLFHEVIAASAAAAVLAFRSPRRETALPATIRILSAIAISVGVFRVPLSRPYSHTVAVSAVAAIPLIAIGSFLLQWPSVRRELLDEARLGLMQPEEAIAIANPWRRFNSRGWADPAAHRNFVRLAHRIARRKRQQRRRDEMTARLHQVEILQLRTQLQEMSRINALLLAPPADDLPSSDTIRRSQ